MSDSPRLSRSTWIVANGQVETILPDEQIVKPRRLSAGDPVAIEPVFEAGRLVWRVDLDPDDPDAGNVRALKARTEEFRQAVLRWPNVMSVASSLTEHVEETADVDMEFDLDGDTLWVRPWPRHTPDPHLRPALGVATSTHVLYADGPRYVLDLAKAHSDALDLEAGQDVAWWLAVREGELALVADFVVPDDCADDANVRSVIGHTSGNPEYGGSMRTQFRVIPPKQLVDALGWGASTVSVSVEENQIVLRATAESAEVEVEEQTPVGEESDATV